MNVSGTAPNCVVTITPAPGITGTSDITLTVTDGKNISSTTFTVNAYGQPSASANPVQTAIVGRAYAGFTVAGSGGLAPYTYSLASGSLPSGLTINPATGAVSGTPSAFGKFSSIVFRVNDSDGGTATTAPFDLYVASYYSDLTAGTTLDGAMSFFRASPATRVAASGLVQTVLDGVPRFEWDPINSAPKGVLVEEGRENILAASEHFEVSTLWKPVRASVTADAAGIAAPDGTISADLLSETATSGVHSVGTDKITKTASKAFYTLSVYAKAKARAGLTLRLSNEAGTAGARAICNLSGVGSATADGTGFDNGEANVQALQNGWYRCSLTAESDATNSIIPEIRLYNGSDEVYTGDTNFGAYLWGAQLEAGRGLTSYIPSHSILSNSEEISTTSGWVLSDSSRIDITQNNSAAPDGNVTADRVNDSGTGFLSGGSYIERQITISPIASTYTVSFFVKKGAGQIMAARAETGGPGASANSGIAFNPADQRFTAMSGSTAPTGVRVEEIGGYYRVAFPVTTRNNNSTLTVQIYPAWTDALNGNGLGNSTGQDATVTGSIHLWGVQILPGALPANLPAYFRRTAATIRAPDLVNIPSIASSAFNTTESTMVSAVNFDVTPGGNATALCFSDGSTNNRITHGYTRTLALLELISGAAPQTPAIKPQTPLGVMKMAASYKANDIAIAVNGTMGGTSSLAAMPSVNTIRLGRAEGDSSFLNGHLRSFLYFPNRLPNALLPGLSLP